KGSNQSCLSSIVARTLINHSIPTGRVNIQVMQRGQKWCMSCLTPPSTASPLVSSNPSAATAMESEKALALILWQPVQWQAIVSKGGLVIRKRVSLERQPPSQGRFHWSIVPPAEQSPSETTEWGQVRDR